MFDYSSTTRPILFLLKATTKKQIWVPQFTKKNGQVVGGHFTMVHVADDHDHHKVASGAGTFSQKKAHAQLKNEPNYHQLGAEDQAAVVMLHATQIQDAESNAAILSKLKKKLLEGEKPTPGMWSVYHAASPEKQQAVMDVVHAAGKAGLMDSLYADYVAKLPPANEKPAEAAPPAPAPEAKKEPEPAPKEEPKAEPAKPASEAPVPAAATPEPEAKPAGLAMPEFADGKSTTGVKVYYEKMGQKIIDMAAAGDVAGLEAMPNPEKGQSWKGKTANSKALMALHAAALAQAKGDKPAAPVAAPAAPAGEPPMPELTGYMAYGADIKEAIGKGDPAMIKQVISEVQDSMEYATPAAGSNAAKVLEYGNAALAYLEAKKAAPARASKFTDAKKDPHKELAAQVSAAGFPTMVGSKGVLLASSPDFPKTYANQTQAANAASKLYAEGFDAEVIGMHPYLVKIHGIVPGGKQAPLPPLPEDGPHEGDTKEGKGGTLVLKDGHWVLSAADNGSWAYLKDADSDESTKTVMEAAQEWLAANPDKSAELSSSLVDLGFLEYAKKLGIYVPPGAQKSPAPAPSEPKPATTSAVDSLPVELDNVLAKIDNHDEAVDVAEQYVAMEKKTPEAYDAAVGALTKHGFKAAADMMALASLVGDAGAAPAPAAHADDAAIDAFAMKVAGMSLPSSNVNAKTINAKLQIIHDAVKAGDTQALLAMSHGSNNYAKGVVKLANEALALLGSRHQVSLSQKAGEHPKLKMVSVKAGAPAAAAPEQAPAVTEPAAAAPAPKFGMFAGLEEDIDEAVAKGDKGTLADIKAYLTTPQNEAIPGSKEMLAYMESKDTPAAAAPAAPVPPSTEGMNDIKQEVLAGAVENFKKKDLAALEQQQQGLAGINSYAPIHQYVTEAIAHLKANPGAAPAAAAPVEQGPKDGDTKQGADGMLVFENGRWHKMGDDPAVLKKKANSVPMPKLKGTHAIKMGKAMKAMKAAAESGGAAGLAEWVKITGGGHVAIKGYKTINPDESKYGPAAEAAAKYAKALVEAMAGTKGSSAPQEAPAAAVEPKATAGAQSAPAASKPAPDGIKTLMVSRILNGGIKNADHWTKTGDQKGSNTGGFYTDGDGQQWYVKTPESVDHVKNELLANKLYAALGIKVPEVTQVKLGGKLSIASKVVDGLKKDPDALKSSDDMLMGFGADAWLANWDAVGLTHDNAMVAKDGGVYRIDPGGAMLYRAQGSAKGAAFGNTVTELDTLRDASKNPQAASVFGSMTPEQIEESVKQVLLLKDAAIQKLCMAYGPGDKAAREALAAKLIARKADLAAKFPNAAKAAGPQKKVHIAPAPNFKEWKGPGQGLSSVAAFNDQNQSLAEEMQTLAADGDLAGLESMTYQPIDKAGEAVGEKKPIAQHQSQHIPMYWKDLINALKNPIRSVEHMKDAVVETVGGVFGTLISAFDDVKQLTAAASRIGRYAVLGKVDGDPFESWKPAGLSKANGKVNSKELYDASMAKYKALSNIEKEAIKQYTGSSYSSMNNPATGVGSHSNTDYAIAGVDKASVPLKAGTVLSRRFPFHNKADLDKFLSSAEGSILKDFGMVSTSLKSNFWHGQIQLRIVCGEGVKGCFVDRDPTTGGSPISQNPGEDEILLPYGTKFFVRKVYAKGHKFTDEHGDWGKHGGTEYVVEVVALPNS